MQADVDLLIIGGGINGAGIARDAAGRGLSVMLVEQDDLAQHTSSASTKLIHGGLRYLEYFEFRLVREALQERERLLKIAPHIIRPQLIILPHRNAVRPAWLIRMGLFLYDHLAKRETIPASDGFKLQESAYAAPLSETIERAFRFYDCWVDDARLVILNALSAAELGAQILPRTRLIKAEREDGHWRATIQNVTTAEQQTVTARILVNAAGPWVSDILSKRVGITSAKAVRLVKGSHIIVPKLYDGDQAYMLQHTDRRIVFVIPYQDVFTMVGTTESPWTNDPATARIDEQEIEYLCFVVNSYFKKQIGPADIAYSFSGVRPLFDDGKSSASAVTRDYILDVNGADGQAPILTVFGGKLTTYRRLGEQAMEKLEPLLQTGSKAWTASRPLPGGDFTGPVETLAQTLRNEFPFVTPSLVQRYAAAYGTRTRTLLKTVRDEVGLGEHFGGSLYQAEVDYLMNVEWACSAEDILFRRTKLGLHTDNETVQRLHDYIQSNVVPVEPVPR